MLQVSFDPLARAWRKGRFRIETRRRPNLVNGFEIFVRDGDTVISRVLNTSEQNSIPLVVDGMCKELERQAPLPPPMTATEVQARQYGAGLTLAKLMAIKAQFIDNEINPPMVFDPLSNYSAQMGAYGSAIIDKTLIEAMHRRILLGAALMPSRLRPINITQPWVLSPSSDDCVTGEQTGEADCGPEGDGFMGETNRVLTPEFRASFPKLFKAEAFQEGQTPKYSLVMLFPKQMTPEMQKRFDAMKKLANDVAKAKWGDKIPKNLRSPFRDGAEKDLPGYDGVIFVSASSKVKPGLVNEDAEPILNPEDFYPGCYAHAYVTCYAYDTAGNRGVSFGLSTVQKTRDGEAFAPRNNAQDDFAPVTPGSDLADNAVVAPEDVFKL